MDSHGGNTNGKPVVSRNEPLRLSAHKRRQLSILFSPAIESWIEREAARNRCSRSEQVNRFLTHYQKMLEGADSEVVVEKIGRTLDGVTKHLTHLKDADDLLKTMVAMLAQALLDPVRYHEWEQRVQATLKGRSP